jgi:hypothetical protein
MTNPQMPWDAGLRNWDIPCIKGMKVLNMREINLLSVLQESTAEKRAELKLVVQHCDALLVKVATFLGELPSADMPAILATLGDCGIAFDAALAKIEQPSSSCPVAPHIYCYGNEYVVIKASTRRQKHYDVFGAFCIGSQCEDFWCASQRLGTVATGGVTLEMRTSYNYVKLDLHQELSESA